MRILTVIVSVLVTASHAQDPAHASPPIAAEEIRFESGDFTLVGDLLTPPGSGPHPTIVYVWGSGPTDRTRHVGGCGAGVHRAPPRAGLRGVRGRGSATRRPSRDPRRTRLGGRRVGDEDPSGR